MRLHTREPFSKKTVIKLIIGYFQLVKQEENYNLVPDIHSKWYKTSEVSKKTFNNTIRTFDKFRQIVKAYLLEDLKQFLLRQVESHTAEEYIGHVMRFMMVSSSDEGKRNKQEIYQQEMLFAVYALNGEDWLEIMEPAWDLFNNELEYKIKKEAIEYLLLRWAMTVKITLRKWVEEGLDEGLISYYRKTIVYFLKKIPGEEREIQTIREIEMYRQLERSNNPKIALKELPEDSWYRKWKESEQ